MADSESTADEGRAARHDNKTRVDGFKPQVRHEQLDSVPRRGNVRTARFDITGTDRVDGTTFEALRRLAPNGRVLLQFSCGKDSIAAWLELRKAGFTVVPVFKEIIKDLGFITRCLAEYEKFFDTEILVIPHRKQFLSLWLNYGNTALASRAEVDAATLHFASNAQMDRDRRNIVEYLLFENNCDVCVIGTKASDNLSRRVNFQVGGPYNANENTFALTWKLKRNAPIEIMLEEKCPIPGFYLWLGRSPELLFDAEFAFIQRYYPDDYARIRAVLPDIDVRVKKFEMSEKPRLLKPLKEVIEAKKNGHPFIL